MHCFVYASKRKPGAYVWLRERDRFDVLPATLLQLVGELRFVVEVDLHAARRLPNQDAAQVLASLQREGWHLQLPPDDRDRDGG